MYTILKYKPFKTHFKLKKGQVLYLNFKSLY